MAIISLPIDYLKPHSIMRLWGAFDIPVFRIPYFNSDEDISNFITNNDTIEFGAKLQDAPTYLAFGIYKGLLSAALSKYQSGVEDGRHVYDSFDTTVNGKTITYSLFSNQSHPNGKMATNVFSAWTYTPKSTQIFLPSAVVALDERYSSKLSAVIGGNPISEACFITYPVNGENRYVLMPLAIHIFNQGINNQPQAVLYDISPYRTYFNNNASFFYGANLAVPVYFSEINGATDVLPVPINPYDPIDPSGPSEGEGTFDFESDPVPLPPIPTLSSSNTGFTRIFNPTLSQVQALANYLWTDESFFKTVWNQIKQVFDDPISAIIAFNLVPVAVPDAGNVEFKLMYIPTGVTMNVAASQFVDVDCGTLTVERVYGSALDYSPYTKISCFLPFVGTVTLNTDEVMNRTLQVKYRVDICSGACVAIILVDGTVMYQFTGHCAINIPMNGADFSTYVSALTAAAKIGLGAATGAGLIAAAAPVPEVTQTTSQTTTRKTERNPETGRQITSWTKDVQRNVEETVTKASHDGLTPANVANTVGSVMGSKPYIERSGSFTGNSGYLGVRRPYLIIERPNLCMPANFQSLNGFPAMMTLPLSSCKGFTRVQQVQLTKCTATNPEQAEILEFLKAGVYL